ncbi:MAG: MOP flippase family protein, partial [Ignavibacteria bacterium]
MNVSSFVISGFKWSSFSQYSRQVLQLITTTILARLLDPKDFGLIGASMVFIGFAGIFKDLGTSAAIIQKKDIPKNFISSIFWFNIFLGTFFTLILILFSPLIASLYNESRLNGIIKALSISFFLSSTSILNQTLLEKNLEFKKIAKAEFLSSLIGAFTGISFAFLGFGVWSLVLQALSSSFINSILLWYLTKPILSFSFNKIHLLSILKFGSNFTGFNIFNYFVRNSDVFLIGKYLGTESLGYYTLAYKLMLYPIQSITGVINRVMFPVYSQLDDDQKLREIYIKITLGIAFFTFPLMAGISGIGDILVIAVFGEKWRLSGTILMILAPVGLLQSIDCTTGSLFLAKGRTDILFRWGIVTGLVTLVAVIIGLNWGIIGVAFSY